MQRLTIMYAGAAIARATPALLVHALNAGKTPSKACQEGGTRRARTVDIKIRVVMTR